MADVHDIFDQTLMPNPVTSFTLFRGVTDYTNLAQFDLYESGYSFLILLDIPAFMKKLKDVNKNSYGTLIDNYRHLIEYEFRGAQGIEDITGETTPLTNGITDLNVITKVTEQGGTQFTMNYFERSGSIITKTHELFLRGVKDPRTQVKRYHGLLNSPLSSRNNSLETGTDAARQQGQNNDTDTNTSEMQDKGYAYELFHFLLIVTDNTALNVEKAYILAACQPALANTSIYNVTRGEIQFQEIGVQFNGLPIPGRIVTKKAVDFLAKINDYTCFDEMDFYYNVLSDDEYGDVDTVMTNNNLARSNIVTSDYNKKAKGSEEGS
jgi:hypothetical protein